jgi:acetyl-CoA synthetase (ADP-forming)/3-hydroxypropionyl-CoA synthetase (ADP-forming)
MDLEPFFESIDLNPVMCDSDRCVVADARIILLPER